MSLPGNQFKGDNTETTLLVADGQKLIEISAVHFRLAPGHKQQALIGRIEVSSTLAQLLLKFHRVPPLVVDS